jgi:diguanylate cyclase (GGDEF)-like protein
MKRGKGICAVALVIGASGAGLGLAGVAGTAAAAGDQGGWRAPAATAQQTPHGPQGVFHGQQSAGPAAAPPSAAATSQNSSPGNAATGHAGGTGQGSQAEGSHGNGHGKGTGTSQPQSQPSSTPSSGASQGSQGAAGPPPAAPTTQSPAQSEPQGGGQSGGGNGNGQGDQGTGQGDQGNGQGDQHGNGHDGGQGDGQGGGSQSPQSQLGQQGQGKQGRSTGQGQGSSNSHSSQGGCTGSCRQSPQSLLSGTGQSGSSIPSVPTISNTTQNGLQPSQIPAVTPPTSVPPPTPPTTPTVTTINHTSPAPASGSNFSSPLPSFPIRPPHVTAPATPVLGPGLGLGLGVGLGPAVTLPGGATATPLLTAAAPATTAGATTAARSTGQANSSAHHGGSQSGPSSPVIRVINQIEKVVPGFVWLALAASIALAALGTGAALLAGRRVRRQAGQFAAVSAAAMTDPLTGVLNRRGFVDALERELARARRYGLMFTLAYVDVRGLKAVNDSEGHLAGDELLKQAAGLLKDSARADDVVGRIGGDEMGLLLVEQGADGADAVIRRVTSQIPERREAMGLHSPWDLTVGMASFPEDGSTVNELLATADRRLYEQRGIALR